MERAKEKEKNISILRAFLVIKIVGCFDFLTCEMALDELHVTNLDWVVHRVDGLSGSTALWWEWRRQRRSQRCVAG